MAARNGVASTSGLTSGHRRVGILTGISYQSGLDYYKGINEGFIARAERVPGHPMPPNPEIHLISVDCALYAAMLCDKNWKGVRGLLWKRGILPLVKALERGEIDFIVQASNTSHLALEQAKLAEDDIEEKTNYAQLNESYGEKFLHIADATVASMRERMSLHLQPPGKKLRTSSDVQPSEKKLIVGLIGTEPTMRERYLKDRLLMHADLIGEVVVPDEPDLGKIFHYIMTELGCPAGTDPETGRPQYKASTKQYFLDVIRKMVSEKGADCILLGCTEIELLVAQEDLPEIPVFASAALHIEAAIEVALGRREIAEYCPEK